MSSEIDSVRFMQNPFSAVTVDCLIKLAIPVEYIPLMRDNEKVLDEIHNLTAKLKTDIINTILSNGE